MKFVKGFIVSIVIYVGLSFLFYGLVQNSFTDIFSNGMTSLSPVFYFFIASPSFMTVFDSIFSLVHSPTSLDLWIWVLGSILPIAVAVLVGSLVERKSGSTKYIFFSTFMGLLVIAFIGIAIQAMSWPPEGITLGLPFIGNQYQFWEWFLPGALITAAINAFVWCSIGLFITNKGWG